MLGLMAGVALAVGLPVLSAFVDYKLHPGDEWAGLAGLYLGGMVGAALLLVSTIAAFAIGGRHGSPLSRGLARGLLLCIGLVGLVAGVCALAM